MPHPHARAVPIATSRQVGLSLRRAHHFLDLIDIDITNGGRPGQKDITRIRAELDAAAAAYRANPVYSTIATRKRHRDLEHLAKQRLRDILRRRPTEPTQ